MKERPILTYEEMGKIFNKKKFEKCKICGSAKKTYTCEYEYEEQNIYVRFSIEPRIYYLEIACECGRKENFIYKGA